MIGTDLSKNGRSREEQRGRRRHGHEREFWRLRSELEQAGQDSKLPETPAGKQALNDLLIRIKLEQGLAKPSNG
jgi:hypothetical protein